MEIGYCLEALVKSEQNMKSVLRINREMNSESGFKSIEKWAHKYPESYTAKRYQLIKGLPQSERTWACVQDFLNRYLASLDVKEFDSIFVANTMLDLKAIGKEPTVLFLNVPDHDSSCSNVVDAFNAQLIQVLIDTADKEKSGRLPLKVRIVFDDFAASASRMPDFEKVISVIRSRDISVSIVLQALSQLEASYGKPDARTIISNCDHWLFLGTRELETAEFIGAMINKTATAVLNLPSDKAILITSGHPYQEVNKIRPDSECNVIDDKALRYKESERALRQSGRGVYQYWEACFNIDSQAGHIPVVRTNEYMRELVSKSPFVVRLLPGEKESGKPCIKIMDGDILLGLVQEEYYVSRLQGLGEAVVYVDDHAQTNRYSGYIYKAQEPSQKQYHMVKNAYDNGLIDALPEKYERHIYSKLIAQIMAIKAETSAVPQSE